MKTLGDHLKNIREVRNISLAKLSEMTKIKKRFLSAIEEGQWEKLPELPIVVGFVKSIANVLDVNSDALVSLLKRDYPPKDIKVNPNPEVPKEFRIGPKHLFFSGVSLIIISIVAYLIFQYSQFTRPPMLDVISPQDGQEIFTEVLSVNGLTEESASVIVNDQPAFVDTDGNFYTEIKVTDSLETIEVIAKSRSGRESRQTIKVKINKQ